MAETHPRRWNPFKLSTILVLVGILGWAMAIKPWWFHRAIKGVWLTAEEYHASALYNPYMPPA